MPNSQVPVQIVQTVAQVNADRNWVDVFMTGVDGKVYHKWYRPDTGWNGYEVITDQL